MMEPDMKAAEERRMELLALARRSRIKWVTDAADKAVTEVAIIKSPESAAAARRKFPASGSIQSVLDVLNEIIDDGENVDVDSIIALIPNDKDMDEVASTAVPSHDGPDGPRHPYAVFIEKLKHLGAMDIVKSMQKFISKFEQNIKAFHLELILSDAQSKREDDDGESAVVSSQSIQSIWNFIDHISGIMRLNFLWSQETDSQWEKSVGCCEKFVFIKLHPLLFSCDLEDSLLDSKLHDRIASLAFLTGEHLDIKPLARGVTLAAPVRTLLRLNDSHSPADKLGILKATSLSIAACLKESRSDGSIPGADEFLPMMILCIKEANPPQLNSNVKYLQRYTNPAKLASESGYLLTHFVSAVHFLEHVDAHALTISPEEYERSMRRCVAAAKKATDAMVHNGRAREGIKALSSEPARASTAQEGPLEYDESDIRWRYLGPPGGHSAAPVPEVEPAIDDFSIGISGVSVLSGDIPVRKAAVSPSKAKAARATEDEKYLSIMAELLAKEAATSSAASEHPPKDPMTYYRQLSAASSRSSAASASARKAELIQERSSSQSALSVSTRRTIAAAASRFSSRATSPSRDPSEALQISGKFMHSCESDLALADVRALLAEYKVLLRGAIVLAEHR